MTSLSIRETPRALPRGLFAAQSDVSRTAVRHPGHLCQSWMSSNARKRRHAQVIAAAGVRGRQRQAQASRQRQVGERDHEVDRLQTAVTNNRIDVAASMPAARGTATVGAGIAGRDCAAGGAALARRIWQTSSPSGPENSFAVACARSALVVKTGAIESWKGARAVEWTGLENRQHLTVFVGSNPTPSARMPPTRPARQLG